MQTHANKPQEKKMIDIFHQRYKGKSSKTFNGEIYYEIWA